MDIISRLGDIGWNIQRKGINPTNVTIYYRVCIFGCKNNVKQT
jgi:hypothetical protein